MEKNGLPLNGLLGVVGTCKLHFELYHSCYPIYLSVKNEQKVFKCHLTKMSRQRLVG